tara:strand:+ start:933 stop:1061 length:129 start_codon:yes stop_codon:yes gene_type:complete
LAKAKSAEIDISIDDIYASSARAEANAKNGKVAQAIANSLTG